MLFWPFLLVCVQACMVQNVFSQCIGPYSTSPALTCNEALNIITAPFVASVTAPFTDSFLVQTAADACSAYGGAGLGETAVAGDLPSAGTTVLAGQVPVTGALEFGGLVSAAGTVSITATCASGCRGSNVI